MFDYTTVKSNVISISRSDVSSLESLSIYSDTFQPNWVQANIEEEPGTMKVAAMYMQFAHIKQFNRNPHHKEVLMVFYWLG